MHLVCEKLPKQRDFRRISSLSQVPTETISELLLRVLYFWCLMHLTLESVCKGRTHCFFIAFLHNTSVSLQFASEIMLLNGDHDPRRRPIELI